MTPAQETATTPYEGAYGPSPQRGTGGAALVGIRAAVPAIAGYVLPFLLVLYLAIKGGGYAPIVRGEVGVAVWWVLLLGAAVGVLPVARISRLGWALLGLFAVYVVWTAIGISWSESSERSVAELGRVAMYLGVFALLLATQTEGSLRRAVIGVAAAIGVAAVLALASRLHPAWFPDQELGALGARARLSYPLNYWNGLATLMAIGVPLTLCAVTQARSLVGRALATTALPLLALTSYYTLSRGGAAEIGAGLIVFFALYPQRLAALPTALLGGAGSAILVAAARQRDALEAGLANQAAQDQAHQMLAVILVVCAGVALVSVALGLMARHGVGPRLVVSRRGAVGAAVVSLVVVLSVALATGMPGEIADAWDSFKQRADPEINTTAERFESLSGNGRYQLWEAAVEANATSPLQGIGPGTYEFWWAREGSLPIFVRDAHSLYVENLAELGIVGLALIACLVFSPIGAGIKRSLDPARQLAPWTAAATAGCVVFALAAAVDWAWELTVLPVAFLLLAAALAAPARREEAVTGAGAAPPGRARVVLGVIALLGLVAVAVPLAGASALETSQENAGSGDLDDALDQANRAAAVQPYAASPSLQKALVLELRADYDAAAAAARRATEDEPTNWRTWLILSRIEAFRGDTDAAIRAYREARSLNPRSPVFTRR